MLRTIRSISLIFLTGTMTGGYGVHNYEANHLRDIAARGFCANRDVDSNFFWFSCQDSYFAAQLQQNDAEQAADTAVILSDMATKKRPKRK